MNLYELSKQFMIQHINSVVLDDLPLSERVYRIEHSIRVSKYARMIAEAHGFDVTVCSVAGILHDVGKFESEINKDHGRISAVIAKKFLDTLQLDKKLVDDICYCIAKHCDGEAGYEYEHIIEADIVSDSDNIDRFGIYRIIQALHYSDFDSMTLEEKYKFCNEKITRLEDYVLKKLNTSTSTKLFNDACSLQLGYFKRLKEEIEFTFGDIVYINAEQECLKNGAVGVLIADEKGKQKEIVFTGKIISTMSIKEKNEKVYQILAEEYDVCFIFDDNVPNIDFYPVPKLEIFAYDSFDGYFCSTSNDLNINEKDAPIYYVDKILNCYYLTSNLREFFELITYNPLWKKELFGYDILHTKSQENKQYLIDILNLYEGNCRKEIKIDKSIIMYKSFEDAKKVISFYDLTEITER